jgi:DNA-binding MarR family transcriptional regulator
MLQHIVLDVFDDYNRAGLEFYPLRVSTLGYSMKDKYTPLQGQYLSFIYYYSKIHGRAPAEADLEKYFKVAYSSVHQMILTLEKRGLITRTPGEARSIRVLLSPEELPYLK